MAPYSEQDFQAELMCPQKLIWIPRGPFEDNIPIFEKALPKNSHQDNTSFCSLRGSYLVAPTDYSLPLGKS